MPGPISKTVFPILNRLVAGLIVVLPLVAAFIASPSRNACATSLQTACDPEFMDAMQARGYMEAQRQIEQNGNLILKQDSVLEYTCFDRLMGHVSFDPAWDNIPKIDPAGATCQGPFTDCGFSGSDNGSIFNQSANALYGSLSSVTFTALNKYIITNYGNTVKPHNYLSGRGGVPSWGYTNLAHASYNCTDMNTVWESAHCMNFFDQVDHDAFFDFYWYAIQDARTVDFSKAWLAAAAGGRNMCQGNLYTGSLPPNANLVFNDKNDIEVAFNKNGPKFGGLYYGGVGPNENNWSKPPGKTDVVPYPPDPLVTRLDLMLVPGGPAPAPASCNNVLPIPTGICVIREDLSDVYQDAWCPNPNCHYEYPSPPVNSTPGANPANCNAAQLGKCVP